MRRTFAAVLSMLLMIALGSASAVTTPPSFRITNTGTNGVELNLGFTTNGTIFYGGWDHIAYSTDHGATWHATAGQPPIPIAADRVLVVDRTTNRVFVEDTDLACGILSWSDDMGKTWLVNPAACGGGITDHAKVAIGKRTTLTDPTRALYPNIVYICANGLAYSPCTASVDGGLIFGPGVPAGLVDVTNKKATLTCAFQGTPVAAPDGTLFQPKTQCGATVEWSKDNGLTWTRSNVSTDASADAPDMTVTGDGALYYLWSKSNWRPYLARSRDGGKTWGAPIAVASSLRSVVFPVIASGVNGHLGIAFYGTTDNPSGWSGNPGDAPASVRWYLYAATISNGSAVTPTVNLVKVTPNPVNIGCLSKLGGCGKGNVGDYIDADVSPDGHLAIAYMVNCPSGCTNAAGSDADQGWIAYQTGGSLLR